MNFFGVLVYCLAYICLVIGYVKGMDESFTDNQPKQLYSFPMAQNYEEIQQHDLHQFIEKRRQKKWVIENDSNHCVSLVLKASYVDRNYGKERAESAPLWTLMLGAHETFTAGSKFFGEENRKVIYEDICFVEKNGGHIDTPLYLNLEKSDDTYKIHIQTIYTTVFPQIIDFSDFMPHLLYDSTMDTPVVVCPSQQVVNGAVVPIINPCDDPYVNPVVPCDDPSIKPVVVCEDPNHVYLGQESLFSPQDILKKSLGSQTKVVSTALSLTPDNLELGFIKQYNSHLNYLFKVQFVQEKMDKDGYFSKLNEIYERNFFKKMDSSFYSEQAISILKIPAIIHTIWFTSDEDPKEFPKRYLYWLEKSIEACPASHGFEHWFWVHDKSKVPATMEALSKMNVIVRETGELGNFPLRNLYNNEMKNCRFGRLSDIFRMVILNEFGGFYKDTDYRIHQSLLPLLQSYDFIAAREPMSSFVCNAFMGACPGHPVIQRIIKLIARNYDEELSPQYIKNINDVDGFKTILLTGPAVVVTGIAQAIDQPGYTDIVLPHPYFYPTPVDAYPQKWPSKPNQMVPEMAYGVHYWETSWAKTRSKEFGSFG